MTVAHGTHDDGRGRRYDPDDALMLAVTDAPVPEEARADAAFMAEHAAAAADVAALRAGLRAVGDTLARGPGEEPPAPRRPVRGPRSGELWRRGLLVLAAMLATGLIGGVVWLGAWGGAGDDAGSGDDKAYPAHSGPQRDAEDEGPLPGGKRSPEGYVACARLIVEGTVLSVETLPGGIEDRITLDVTRSYKPAKAPDEVTFVMEVNADPRLRAGDRALIGIPQGEASPDIWSTGKEIEEDRRWIMKALPGSRGLEC
ncbi:hypothetical protein RB200_38655 [Streptomyces sp. PmtG]